MRGQLLDFKEFNRRIALPSGLAEIKSGILDGNIGILLLENFEFLEGLDDEILEAMADRVKGWQVEKGLKRTGK